MPFNQQMTATEDTTVHLGSTNLILLTQRMGPLCLETAPFWDYIQVNYAQKAPFGEILDADYLKGNLTCYIVKC